MSLTEGIRGYGLLLGRPGLRRMVVWGLIGRLPMGMMALALVLLVRGAGGTYAAAGFVTAASAGAAAIGAPFGGRMVDRHRPARVLAVYAVCHPAALTLLLVLAATDRPVWTLGAAAAVSGACFPPIGPTVRMLWPSLVRSDRERTTAFAMEATLQELIFVSGPLLVGVLAATVSSSAGVVAAAVLSAVGVVGFATSRPVRERAARDAAEHGHRHLLAAVAPGGVRRMILFSMGYGVAFGAVEVAMPAFAESHGGRALSGIVLACWSAGSLAGGVLAAGHGGEHLTRRLRQLSIVFTAVLVLPLLAGSIPVMAAVMFLAGMPIAPSFAVTYNLLERAALPGTQAEVFGWVSTAITIGLAAGTAGGGNLIFHVGIDASLLLGIAGAGAAACIALTSPPPDASSPADIIAAPTAIR